MEMVERVARALMLVTAKPPASTGGPEVPVLSLDPDYDDLPWNAEQGTLDDEITQEAVLRLAQAAIKAMREPTAAMLDAGPGEPYMDADVWAKMIDAANGQSGKDAEK